jgi:hypothetical protein
MQVAAQAPPIFVIRRITPYLFRSKGTIKFVKVLEPSNCSKGSMCSSGDGTPVLNQPPQNFHNSLSMFKINNRKRKGRGTGPCNHPAKRAGVQYTSVLRPLVVLTLDEKRARNVLCRSVK